MFNPVVEEIIDFVKEQIMSETFVDGERISERFISEKFNVSRTIVREAMFELKRQGWIYAENKSGTYVAPMNLETMKQNYMARLALEPQILLMAFPNLDDGAIAKMRENCALMESAETQALYSLREHEQHKIIYTYAHNVYVESFISQMMDSMVRVGAKAGRDEQRRFQCIGEWKSIIAALEKRDPLMAMSRFAQHIQKSYEVFMLNTTGKKQ